MLTEIKATCSCPQKRQAALPVPCGPRKRKESLRKSLKPKREDYREHTICVYRKLLHFASFLLSNENSPCCSDVGEKTFPTHSLTLNAWKRKQTGPRKAYLHHREHQYLLSLSFQLKLILDVSEKKDEEKQKNSQAWYKESVKHVSGLYFHFMLPSQNLSLVSGHPVWPL